MATLALSLAWFSLAYLAHRRIGRYAVIDLFWSPSFVVFLGFSLLASHVASARSLHPWFALAAHDQLIRYVALGVVALWAARLTGHLAHRQRDGHEDPRYSYLSARSIQRFGPRGPLLTIFLPQALLSWFVSMPLQWLAYAPHFNTTMVLVGGALTVVGIGVEGVADEQLRRFRTNPANADSVMDRGLWRWSRHPNHFGDAVLWWGFALAAAATGVGAWTLLSAVGMTYLLTNVSGRPMTESVIRRHRPGYDDYVARTSAFIPWPPKRSSA